MSKQDILMAIMMIARFLGPIKGRAAAVMEFVKMVVIHPSVVRGTLIDLLTQCVLLKGTERPRLDYRGDILVGVEVKPDERYPNMPVLVTTHQRRYRVSAEVAKERGLRLHPVLISREDRLRLQVCLLTVKWAESVGIFSTGMTVREDGSLEVGLKPTSIAGKLEDTELYQHRHDKTSDTTRERWWYVLERERTKRVDRFTWPVFDYVKREKGGLQLVNGLYWDSEYGGVRSIGRLEDRPVISGSYDGPDSIGTEEQTDAGDDLKPLRRPTLEDNQLWHRERYRLGWNIAAWSWTGKNFRRISKDKVVQLSNGDLWVPKDDSGNPEQDYFGDVRETLSWWDKKELKRITVKRWRKTAFWRNELTFVVPEIQPDESIKWRTLKGRELSSDEALALAARKDVIVRRDPSVTAELDGLIRAAIEKPAFAAVELVEKTIGFGASPTLEAPCRRCTEKWGFTAPKLWVAMPHAHVCNTCGAEVWRFMARVYIDRKEFPFLRLPTSCTHISAEVFGPWVGERMLKGHKPGKLRVTRDLVTV